MEDAYIEIVQPRHLRPFIPLAAQELQDNLDRMPFPIAVWYANEFRYVIRQCKKSWHWYYARVPDLWTYLDSLDHAISTYPEVVGQVPLTAHASPEDARYLQGIFMENWGRFDCTAEALVWAFLRVHLPCWGLILSPAPIEGLHE